MIMKCENCGSERNVNKIDGVQICMICNAEKTIRSADNKIVDMLAERYAFKDDQELVIKNINDRINFLEELVFKLHNIKIGVCDD